MKNFKPTLNDYMVVESLAHHKSISKAAEEHSISPSAFSRQLSSLESKLGTRIFNRDTRNISLTTIGWEFYQNAEKILCTMEENLGCFGSQLKDRLKRLKIVALPSVCSTLLPKILDGFMLKHPEVDLQVSDINSSDLIETVDNGSADLGFTVGSVPVRSKLSFHPLIEDDFTIISGIADSSVTKKEYSIEEIVEMPFIALKRGTSTRDFVEIVCEHENLVFKPKIEVNYALTAVALVSKGLGISILPKLVLFGLNPKGLKYHNISNFYKPRQIGIVYRYGKTLSPAAVKFLNHAKEEIQDLYQSIHMEL